MDVQTCQSSDLANGRRFTAPLLGGISLEQLVAEDLQETREFQIQEKKKEDLSFSPRLFAQFNRIS